MATLQDVKNAYTLGKKESDQLKIAQDTRETSPNARRQYIPERYGVGGYEDNPFDDFGNFRGPAIQNPQTKLFEWAMNQLQINPEIAHSPSGTYDEYGAPRETPPWKGVDPSGNPITIPWLKEYYQKQHPNRERLHNQKYHGDVSQVNYDKNMPQGYKDWSKQLEKIMGTKGGKDFIKDLFIHSQNYPKA